MPDRNARMSLRLPQHIGEPPEMRAERLRLEEKLVDLLDRGELLGAVQMAGSSFGAVVLDHAVRCGQGLDQLVEALADVWTMSHAPFFQLAPARWGQLFKLAGYVTDEANIMRPLGPSTIYRGAVMADRGRGMSWTSDPEVARTFAERHAFFTQTENKDKGVVFQLVVPPPHVLGCFGSRNEAEVIVNPWWLRRWAKPVVRERGLEMRNDPSDLGIQPDDPIMGIKLDSPGMEIRSVPTGELLADRNWRSAQGNR